MLALRRAFCAHPGANLYFGAQNGGHGKTEIKEERQNEQQAASQHALKVCQEEVRPRSAFRLEICRLSC